MVLNELENELDSSRQSRLEFFPHYFHRINITFSKVHPLYTKEILL